MLAYVEPGAYPLYATYAGTSMACPMVAGTVALLAQETGGVARPDAYKVVIESTAVDLGLDGMAQGHGRIDAYAAVQYLDGAGSGVVWGTYDSTINYGAVIDVAWAHYMDGSTGWEGENSGLFINSTAMPTDFLDATLYYGVVSPGATVSLSMAGVYADTTDVDATDFTWDSQNYEVDNVWHGIWNTYIYNETTSTGSNSIKAGWFDLQTELDTAYSNFAAAPFATILIGGPTSLNPVPTAYTAKFYAFVFDWSDTDPANGVPDYYNPTTGHGDELTRIQYGGAQHTIRMDLSSPSGVGSLFPTNTPIVAIHDQSIWKWPYTSGTDVNVTIITWKPVSNGELAVSNNVAGGLSVDLTVPNDAEPGVHEGYLVAEGATNYLIPYSYFVSAEVATADGSETTVASGYGNVLNPMEDGASFVSQDYYYTTQSADHHAFIVHVSDTSAKYIGAKVEWANAASSFDVAIVSMTGVELGTSTDANKTSSVSASAIGELSAVPGDYLVYVTTNELYYEQLPSNFTLKVMCWTEVPAPTVTYSWRSIDSPSYTVVTDGGKAVGDHVRMNATWTDAVLTNMPDYKVTGISLQVLKGLLFTGTHALHIPTSGYSPYSGMLHLNEFVWVYVPGIKAGDNVRLTVDFDVTDVDILSYWADTDNTTWTAASDLFGEKLATGAVPEYGSFLADRAGTLAVGLFDYSREAGSAYVTVDTRTGVGKSAYSNTAEVDTYPLQSNCSTAVLVSVDTGTNFKYSDSITVETDNFLYPHLGPVSVSGSGAVKTITWSVSDLNSGDQHFYDLAISSDGGVTFQLLAGYLNTTSYTWDSTGFTQGTYIVRITVYDDDPAYHAAAYGSYWPGLTAVRASASFTAGTVTTTTTTTTTSTTTTTTTTPVTGGIDPLWIGLFGGIGVGILVVLMLFLVRKK